MSKRRNQWYAGITAIALVGWMIAGSYLFSANNCCGGGSSTLLGAGDEVITGMVVRDGDVFQEHFANAIFFEHNQAMPLFTEEASGSLLNVIKYLKSNPIKRLTIMGLYKGNEKGGSRLAMSRADSILQWFTDAKTPDYQLYVKAGRRDDLVYNEERKIVIGAVDFMFSCIAPFEIVDDERQFKLVANNNLVFKYATGRLLMPDNEEMLAVLKKLAAYLIAQPDRKLVLTGYSHPDEKQPTALENIGVLRANTLRNQLVALGVSGKQVAIKGVEDARLAILESELYGKFLPDAMRFDFEAITKKYDRTVLQKYRKIEENFKEKKVFRFKDFGKTENRIFLNNKTKSYIGDLLFYLSMNPKAMVYCVGHSNRRGNEQEAYALAANRAEYAQDFLIQQGVPPNKIMVKSAGFTHALGSETTRYGKQINRRVDLFISYDGKEPQLYALLPKLEQSSKDQPKAKQPSQKPESALGKSKKDSMNSSTPIPDTTKK